MKGMSLDYVLIKGAGDLASGVACVFWKEGYRVVMTETQQPTCVRRMVSFAEAVYEGEICVEGTRGRLAETFGEAMEMAGRGEVAVLVDPRGEVIKEHRPLIFVDAAMTKKNMGTSLNDADIVIALGPGFEAGKDVHAVIETQRGPNLGKPIYKGRAAPNTGVPGNVLGYTSERVLRAPAGGIFYPQLKIGDIVDKGETVALVDDVPVTAKISGVVRGLLKGGLKVHKGMKVGDVHPAKEPEVCFKITDKSWAVGRGALEAVRTLQGKKM